MSAINTLNDYLLQLPAEQQADYRTLLPIVSEMVFIKDHQNDDTNKFIFIPEGNHPDFTDMPHIFFKGFQQIVLTAPSVANEVPIAFFGYHILNRLSKHRTSLGFVLTDKTLYVQDNYSVLFDQSPARAFPLPSNPQDIDAFLNPIFKTYQWEDTLITASTKQAIQTLIAKLISLIVTHQQHDSPIASNQESYTIKSLINRYNVTKAIQYTYDNKTLQKITKKYNIPDNEQIIYSVTDKALFGGHYGFVVTDSALYSKDLFEEPIRIDLTTMIDQSALTLTGKEENIQTTEGSIIFLPKYIETSQKNGIILFIQKTIILIQSKQLILDL